MSQRKKISIRFIAEQCGVSTATVSRVINNDSSVTDSTRRTVLDALEKYEYAASSVTPPKVSKIGTVIVSSHSDYYHAVLGNIGIYMRDRGIGTVAMNTEGQTGHLPFVLDTLYDANVEGLILVGCDYLSIREHLHSKIPHLWIDCNDRPEKTEHIYRVDSDHLVSGSMAAQELLRKGCKKPILLTGTQIGNREKDRIKGFEQEFAAQGLPLAEEQIVHLPELKSSVTESQEMLRYLLSKGADFDSIFAMNDACALGAYVGIRNSGLLIPDDIKLIGFEAVSDACTEVLNITSVQLNVKLITRSACEMLLDRIEKRPVLEKRIVIPTSILPGQTL